MEILQLVLIVTLILLCVTLTALAVYCIFVLKDVKESVEDVKEVSKTVRRLSNYIIAPAATIVSLLGGVTRGINAVKSISSILSEDEEEED
jgi:heme/copper-type cytochrome/quinol oxidase subunit 2